MQPPSAEARFWQWFRANGNRLRAIMYGKDEAAREAASEELRQAVEAFDPPPTLELGPALADGTRTLIVSADGRPEKVDAVKDFAASAPPLPGWRVVTFRQRMSVGDGVVIELQNERIGAEDIWFRVVPADGGLDLTLFVRGLTPQNERVRGLGATLLAEHAVGERDALTMLNSLAVKPLPKTPATAGLRPFGELPGVLDREKAKKYPPPGSLSLPEDEWMNLRGTVNGSLAVILLNAGLRAVASHPDYDRRLTVAVPFNEADEEGMPGSEEEYLAVSDLGDRLSEALQQGQESLLCMTMMTKGRRELVLYTSNADSARRRLKGLLADVETHRVEVDIERDTYWGMYRSFCRATEGADEEE